jgi:hypothetical protein
LACLRKRVPGQLAFGSTHTHQLPRRFPDAIVMGVVRGVDGSTVYNPSRNYVIEPDDSLLLCRPTGLSKHSYQPLPQAPQLAWAEVLDEAAAAKQVRGVVSTLTCCSCRCWALLEGPPSDLLVSDACIDPVLPLLGPTVGTPKRPSGVGAHQPERRGAVRGFGGGGRRLHPLWRRMQRGEHAGQPPRQLRSGPGGGGCGAVAEAISQQQRRGRGGRRR